MKRQEGARLFPVFFYINLTSKRRKIIYFSKKSPLGFDITHIWLTFA